MAILLDIDSITPGTNKVANAIYFGAALVQDPNSNHSKGKPSKFRVVIALATSSVVEYTADDASRWIELNGGTELGANKGYTFDIPIRSTDSFNLRNKTTSVVNRCIVDEVREEA